MTPVASRIQMLVDNEIKFATIVPTKTGLEKSIMDATLSVRLFLRDNNIHHYEYQENGTQNKVIKEAKYILEGELKDLQISLYKSNGRGDTRIWFSGLNSVADANDTIVILFKNENIYILNITQLEIEKLVGKNNPFNDLILAN